MTAIGRIESEFNAFKQEVEKRLAALEEEKKPSKKSETKVVIEAKNNDIVGTEVDTE